MIKLKHTAWETTRLTKSSFAEKKKLKIAKFKSR